jgi:hypothetical protein
MAELTRFITRFSTSPMPTGELQDAVHQLGAVVQHRFGLLELGGRLAEFIEFVLQFLIRQSWLHVDLSAPMAKASGTISLTPNLPRLPMQSSGFVSFGGVGPKRNEES